MGLQIIFCMEAIRTSGTDWVYIDETLKKYYSLSNDIKRTRIFLEGKGNYRKRGVLQKITKYQKAYRGNGNTVVMYCIDTDNIQTDQDQRREYDEISNFCRANGFELVWFCRDIEEVYWGKKADQSDKTKLVSKFRNSNQIDVIGEKFLQSTQIAKKKSNILKVLDKYLPRK